VRLPQAGAQAPPGHQQGARRRGPLEEVGEAYEVLKDLEDMRKRVEYDLDYLRQWSLGLDLAIIFKTVMVVFGDEKAY
jgi:lipopolysaccharide/colanic/teichoic acid biosynthesis glycosyltransferase